MVVIRIVEAVPQQSYFCVVDVLTGNILTDKLKHQRVICPRSGFVYQVIGPHGRPEDVRRTLTYIVRRTMYVVYCT